MKTYWGFLAVIALSMSLVQIAQAGETVTYYHTDALGTPVMESDASGNVTYVREHRSYGEQALGAPKQGVGFTGHMSDADTGLIYMQARYYDSLAGRFVSGDPIASNIQTGMNYNRYWYANDNPFKFIDPDGRISKELKKLGYEDLGDGYVARVDSIQYGGESKFEVHVYKSSPAFEKAALNRNKDGLRAAEQGTITQNGEWGKHGKPERPSLSEGAHKSIGKLVIRETSQRGWIEKGAGGWRVKPSALRSIGRYSRFLGPAGALLNYSTSNSLENACTMDPDFEGC